MHKLLASIFVIAIAAGSQCANAADAAAPKAYADVRIVGSEQYFSAKQNQQPISEQDTLDLIKQDGHALQLCLERWSIDHPPAGKVEVTFYPAGDKLDKELNTWTSPYGSYTGKRQNSRGAGFYPNPISATSPWQFDGVALPVGWGPDAPGNFSYLYQLDDQGRAVHYMLLFYGPQHDGGLDINGDGSADGVILQATDGTEHKQNPGQPWYCNGQPVAGINVLDQE